MASAGLSRPASEASSGSAAGEAAILALAATTGALAA